jgi:hypothetical protein
VRSPELVAAEVAAQLELPQSGGQSYEEALARWLADRDVLLVIDNCEHVLSAVADLVDPLTARLPRLRVLATSREPLWIEGKATFRLAPLSAETAVQLFRERAGVRARSALDTEHAHRTSRRAGGEAHGSRARLSRHKVRLWNRRGLTSPAVRRAYGIALIVMTTWVASSSASTPTVHQKELARVRAIVGSKPGCRELSRKEAATILGVRTPKTFESASACLHAAGRAVSVRVTLECGGDTCTGDGWLFTDVRPTVAIPVDTDYDVSPDARFLYYTRLTLTKSLGEYKVDVARRDLTIGVDVKLAACASPTVSPSGAWVLCRSRTDGVLKVPSGGGAPTVVVKGTGVVINWTPYSRVFPNPVTFLTSDSMEVWTGSKRRVVAWKE